MTEYELFPVVLPFVSNIEEVRENPNAHKAFMKVKDDRLKYFVSFIDLPGGMEGLQNKATAREALVFLDTWLESKLVITDDPLVDIDFDRPLGTAPWRGDADDMTELGVSACCDASLIYAQALIAMDRGFKWYKHRKKSTASEAGTTVLASSEVGMLDWP